MFDAPKGAVCPLGCQGRLLTPIEPDADQHPQVPVCRAVPQSLLSQFILVHGVQDSVLRLHGEVLVAGRGAAGVASLASSHISRLK